MWIAEVDRDAGRSRELGVGGHLRALVPRDRSDQLVGQLSFFDTIERSPLTDEQATAVICFDNRVQVLAAAGIDSTGVRAATFHSFGLEVIGAAEGAPAAPPTPCRSCGTGTMTRRKGRHGWFLGCTNTQNLPR